MINGLRWKSVSCTQYRADIKVNGIFGIRFEYGKRFPLEQYYYKYIINGKKYGDYLGYNCESMEDGKHHCEEKYIEICNKISDVLFVN